MTPSQLQQVAAPRISSVVGGDEVRLHVREWGRRDGPTVLLVHGWSQSMSCWRHQVDGEVAHNCRLVAVDLRGHGMSERPRDATAYQSSGLWAADLAAVIGQLELVRPVLVGWSYGGLVVVDYLRVDGERTVGAVNLVGAAVQLTADFAHIGPGFLDNAPVACDPDLPTSITGLRRLVRAFTAEPMAEVDRDAALCAAMTVPVHVRSALLTRRIANDDVLAGLTVPVLVTHGRRRRDTIVLPAMAEHVLDVCPTASASWYDAGHAPFLEDHSRFDRELLDLAHRALLTLG